MGEHLLVPSGRGMVKVRHVVLAMAYLNMAVVLSLLALTISDISWVHAIMSRAHRAFEVFAPVAAIVCVAVLAQGRRP